MVYPTTCRSRLNSFAVADSLLHARGMDLCGPVVVESSLSGGMRKVLFPGLVDWLEKTSDTTEGVL